jgi:hypothetical protein
MYVCVCVCVCAWPRAGNKFSGQIPNVCELVCMYVFTFHGCYMVSVWLFACLYCIAFHECLFFCIHISMKIFHGIFVCFLKRDLGDTAYNGKGGGGCRITGYLLRAGGRAPWQFHGRRAWRIGFMASFRKARLLPENVKEEHTSIRVDGCISYLRHTRRRSALGRKIRRYTLLLLHVWASSSFKKWDHRVLVRELDEANYCGDSKQ